ncbi:MAG: cytochrome c oxidase assembly protein [Proteobacteria bacterium]|jgi:cytochrome c oxidase assembly protein subunit 11|nr:cytochrome c oxidase assembly protein [Pseudomonadota bacterium]MDA1299727.1 cytochrome c oxidase assembly protein [Pseudomonadota bacterium]
MAEPIRDPTSRPVSHRGTIFRLIGVTVGMFAFGFLLVPLYDIICDVTGLNGKTGGPYAATGELVEDLDREVTVQFITNNNAGMPWEFRPMVRSVTVNPGKMTTAEFYVRNPVDRTIVAQAVPSVTPFHAAEYFHKTECFCFEQQQLVEGQDLMMPLRFVVDPAIPKNVTTLTLSYTLFDITRDAGSLAAN